MATVPAVAADCRQIANDKERLQCYDSAAKPDTPEEPTATTKEVLTSFSPDDYKLVDPEDLYAAPRKFKGRPVMVRNFRCYHADENEYRCVAPGWTILALFAADVQPPEEKARLENSCGTLKALNTSACRKDLRFVARETGQDTVSGRDRILLLAPVIEVVPPSSPAKKGRRR